jgi:hypothetical protein
LVNLTVMQQSGFSDRRKDGSMYDARLDTRITAGVDRRLRMKALAEGVPLNRVLVRLLDKHLPSVDELAALLAKGPQADDAEPAEAAAA